MYLTGEEFTNEFLTALRTNKLDVFRRRVRDLDLLVIDDVHFLGGKKATRRSSSIRSTPSKPLGRQVVMASDNHPKLIEEFGESLVNRFVSGMVVRIDPPNYATRCQILSALAGRTERESVRRSHRLGCPPRHAKRPRMEGAITRIAAQVRLTGHDADVMTAQQALGDLDRQLVAPVPPENVLQSVCDYFGLEHKDLMSGRASAQSASPAASRCSWSARPPSSVSPRSAVRMGKRNHSTVISACRRIERAVL